MIIGNIIRNILRIGVLSIVLFGISSLYAGDTVTVITYSHKYEGVTYKVSQSGTQLLLFGQDLETAVDINDIRYIINKDGYDITSSIINDLGLHVKPPDEKSAPKLIAADPKNSFLKPAKPKSVKLPWNTAIQLGPIFCFPASGYYKGLKRGTGYEGNLHYAIDKDNVMRFSISSVNLPIGDDYRLISTDLDIRILNQKTTFNATRYILGGGSFEYFNKKQPNLNMYYGFFGFGVIRHRMEMNATVEQISTGTIEEISGSTKESKFMLAGAIGGMIAISKNIALNAAFDYDMIFLGKGNGRAYLFDIKVGLFVPLKLVKQTE
jgi:hypothetical protein